MDVFRYGLFALGQIWTLTDPDGARLGFPSRSIALAALQTVVAAHRASGASVLVTIQDRGGRLRTMLNPFEDLTPVRERAVDRFEHESEWNVLLDVRAPQDDARRLGASVSGER